jgi:hypothetical protein
MRLQPLLVVVLNCIRLSSQEAVAEDDFTLFVDDHHVLAVVDLPLNFSVTIHNPKWNNKSAVVRRR